MNTFQLHCFLTVANTLSFARAAEQLNVSQPTITHQIKMLENELNVKLFRRSTRLVEITPEGQTFIEDARSMISIEDRAKMRFSDREEHPIASLAIGCSSYAQLILLTELLHKLNKEIPNFHPRIHVATRNQLFRLLDNQQVHVIFDTKDKRAADNQVKFKELSQSEISCVCRQDHPFAQRDSISIQELTGESLVFCDPVTLSLDQAKLQFHLAEEHAPADLHFCASIDAALVLAASGTGIAFLPDIYITNEPHLAKIPIENAPKLSFGLFYKTFPGDKLLRKFIQITQDFFIGS